jgi:hypothetical protein
MPRQTSSMPRNEANEADGIAVASEAALPRRAALALSTFESLRWPMSRLRLSIQLFQALLNIIILALISALIRQCLSRGLLVPGDVTAVTAIVRPCFIS